MEMCRVCLSTENDRFPLDESFITNYNLLTNLNITLLDGMPQYSCQICKDTVKNFMEFREKSITSETTLRKIIYSKVKPENKTHEIEIDNSWAIKSEIKEESYDSTLEHYDVSFEDFHDDLKDLIINNQEDVKPKRLKKKNKAKIKVKTKKKYEKNHGSTIFDDCKWPCGICPESFENKIVLNKHLDVHKQCRQCLVCWEKVNSLSQLFAHRLAHVSLKQYKCHICDKRYKSSLYLEYHYRNIHIDEDDTRLTCNLCGLKYSSPKKLSGHIGTVHSFVKYICDVCSKGFRDKSSLKSHIKLHYENKAYVCDQCGFSCKHSGGLTDHKLRRHTPKRVYCNKCKRPFLNQERHDRHSCKDKVTVCPICGQQLSANVRLSKHMTKHSNILKYECHRCPAKYKTKSALLAHLDRHDGNRTQHCEYCPAKFYTAAGLIKHRRTHTGEKPYVCKICNKGFTGNYNLKVHMKVHGEYLINKKNGDSEDSQTLKIQD